MVGQDRDDPSSDCETKVMLNGQLFRYDFTPLFVSWHPMGTVSLRRALALWTAQTMSCRPIETNRPGEVGSI